MIVLDASIVTKWFKPDEKSPDADYFLHEHIAGRETIFVPVLLLYELTNALYVSKRLAKEEIDQAITALFDLRLTYVSPNKELLSDALGLSKSAHISIYDASYIALARALKCPFVTADKKLHKSTASFLDVILL